VELPLRRIFELPVLAELAQAIEESKSAASDFQNAPIRRAPREQYRARVYRARVSSEGVLEIPDLVNSKPGASSNKPSNHERG
jgi:hypothetical protein